MFYLCCWYLFMHSGVQHELHIRINMCRRTVTRRVPVVEEESSNFPENLYSPRFLVRFMFCNLYYFCVVFCRILFVFSSFFFSSLYCLSSMPFGYLFHNIVTDFVVYTLVS
jgi:hypothetical protein